MTKYYRPIVRGSSAKRALSARLKSWRWFSFPNSSPRARRWYRALLVVGGLTAVTAIGMVIWLTISLPDPSRLGSRTVAQSTKIYARDGKTVLYEVHGEQKRTVIDLEDIKPYAIQATLSIEDKDFYNHSGISFRGLLRSLFVDIVRGSAAQGGSTITQQLVKNSILTREKKISRKIKEIVLSYQIEHRFSKEQILRMYFNEIPYGGNAYGIEAAARMYFSKSASDLTLSESALLAAMVQRPSYFSPTGSHREELVARQQHVLSLMVEQGYVTAELAEAAKNVDVLKNISPLRDPIIAPHFVFYVRDYLEQKYGSAVVERGGLRVVTTLDPDMQTIAEEEVLKGADRNLKNNHAQNAALVAIEPQTGQIKAMVGSRDFFDEANDGNFNVTTAVRNPGSSFKPIVYLTAFTKGYTPETMLFDLKTNFGPDGSGKDFKPNNYDFKEHGPLPMRRTLAGSLNIPAVKTLYLAGIPATVELAQKLGYTTLDKDKLGLALAIGGGGVKLIEHVGAFAALANDGMRQPVVAIIRVEDRSGKVLEQYESKEERVVESAPVRQLVSVMSDNSARAFVFGANSPLIIAGRPVAAKTGTTNDFKDGWTVGFTPSLAAGVWVGNNDYSPMRSGADGVVVAAPIWHAFMERALKGSPVERFQKPAANNSTKPVLRGQTGEEAVISVDTVTGKKIPASCLDRWPKEFVATKTIKEVHTILWYVQRDDPTGAAPTDPAADPMFTRWEKPVQAWAKKNGFIAAQPSEEDCALRVNAQLPAISISSPAPDAVVTNDQLAVSLSLANIPTPAGISLSIDGQVVQQLEAGVTTATLDLGALASGFHTLTASTLIGEQTITDEVVFNLLSATGTTAYFSTVLPKQNFLTTAFPVAVGVFAYNPGGLTSAALWQENPDGTTAMVDQTNSPPENSFNLTWPTTTPGTYGLFLVVKSADGKTYTSDHVPVVVSAPTPTE